MGGVPSIQAQSNDDLLKRFPWFAKEAGKPPELPTIVVDGNWLAQRLASGEAIPADVRPRDLYETGHLPRAVSFGISRDRFTGVAVRESLGEAGLAGDEVLVLYGGPGDRPAIGQAYLALAAAGWPAVQVLDTTYEQWAGGGLAVETGAGPRRPAARRASSAPTSPFVTAEELRGSFGRAGFEVLDVRGGWGAEQEAPAEFAAGHVPHALPLDVESLLPAEGWPALEKLRRAVGSLGPRPSERVDPEAELLLYGTGPNDPRPGLAFLLLRMAGFAARVYPEGFAGWTADPQSPVVRLLEAPELEHMLRADQRSDGRLADRRPRDFALLDLREDWDYDEEHIPGAHSLPERLFRDEFLLRLREHWPQADRRTTPLVFYCYGRECVRSRICATEAAQMGFLKLLWLREGMDGWSRAGGPVFPKPTGEVSTSPLRRGSRGERP